MVAEYILDLPLELLLLVLELLLPKRCKVLGRRGVRLAVLERARLGFPLPGEVCVRIARVSNVSTAEM